MVLNELNLAALVFVQGFSHPVLDYFFLFVTTFGNPVFWVVISAFLFWQGKEKESFFLMNAVVAASLVVGFFKTVFKFPRPEQSFLSGKSIVEHNFILPSDEYSFPSGHATIAAVAFGFFYKKIKKNTRILFAVVLALVLVSRVYLGKHFPVDVVAGLFFGVAAWKLIDFFNHWFVNTPGRREAGLLTTGLLAVVVVFLFEEFAVITLPLGYYFGLFLFKEMGFDSPKIKGKKFLKKAFFGLFGLGSIFLLLFLVPLEPVFQAMFFFFAGLWITLVFPWLFELTLKTKTATK